MINDTNHKKKEFLSLYWFALGLLGILGLVNLFAISKDSMQAAAIVNLVFLILSVIIFVMGYVDFKNYAPFSKRMEFAYCALGIAVCWIYLIHFNVQNYSTLTAYTGESYYMPWLSALVALYLAIGVICVTLTFLNLHNRRKQVKYYYAVATASFISSLFMIIFTYGTYVSLFWAPLLLMNVDNPIVVDTGITILALRVLIEYCIFVYHAIKERKVKKTGDVEHRPVVVKLCCVAIVFMLINILVLPLIKSAGVVNADKFLSYYYAYESIEGISVSIMLILGAIILVQNKKSEKYGQIYQRMGIAAIVFALVYLISDFFPIAKVAGVSDNMLKSEVAYDVFSSSIQMTGLAVYTVYVAFNKKLNKTLSVLDREHEEASSTENYSI